MTANLPPLQEGIVLFKELLDEYTNREPQSLHLLKETDSVTIINPADDEKAVTRFLNTGCGCKNNCHQLFSEKELLLARSRFRALSRDEKNHYLLGQLQACSRYSEMAKSSRKISPRKHQTFEYCINIDRPVCRHTFLFYHEETIKRLERLQKHLTCDSHQPLMHGNSGRKPATYYDAVDVEAIVSFMLNLAENHGLPDPGRDIRKGKGRLRILLPSIMNYTSVHQLYMNSVDMMGGRSVGYDTFIKIWQKKLPYIVFNNPKTDLCLTCENFKKQLNRAAAILDEDKEQKQEDLHKSALDHLNHVKRERFYYKARIQVAQNHYSKLNTTIDQITANKANSKDIVMHYSWDFAQQLQYPFEDQQVGPIYFKTPRRAQLFGVCCEGIPRQVNYLIDEADFLEKNANTVISLLDHFFANHGLGEKVVYLTADNCVGQNKNNALIQYLLYRVLAGLHTEIELSFLVVGHTKFSPDGYFGLIKRHYRRSQIYTYEQLSNTIEMSSKNGHNVCQCYRNALKDEPEIIYRDWVSWLAQYFRSIPKITSYHHFKIDASGKLFLRKTVDSEETNIALLKNEFSSEQQGLFTALPNRLIPQGLSAERQWYLYDQIRMHIPNTHDKDATCPKPSMKKPKKKTNSDV